MHTSKIISWGLILLYFLLSSCGFKNSEKGEVINSADEYIENKIEKPIRISLVDPVPQLALPVQSHISPLQPNLLPPPPPLGLAIRPTPPSDDDGGCNCKKDCDLGTAGFSTTSPDSWFEISTLPYPQTILLSRNRNNGQVQGDVDLTPNGLEINESGTYWVSFSVVLVNDNEQYTPLIPVFLVQNGQFSPAESAGLLGGVVSLPANLISTVQGSGPLRDVKEGTTLTIIATNGGSPQPEPVRVVSWSMSLYKICD